MLKRLSIIHSRYCIIFFIPLILSLANCQSRAFHSERPGQILSSSRFLDNPTPKFEELSPQSEEWKRLSVRVPDEPVANQSYLENLYHSVQNGFMPWFERSDDRQSLTFAEILRVQHALLVTGKQGRYFGATLEAHNMAQHEIPPGRYRYEIYDKEPDKRLVMSFQIERKLKEGLSPQIERLRKFYISQSNEKKLPEPPHEGPDQLLIFKGSNPAVQVIRLPGIEDERIKVWNEIYEGWITHYYVRLADTPTILQAMGKQIEKIRNHKKRNSNEFADILETLEDFLYLGINLHPFESGNFSLVMSQVNYIITRYGLRGISHGTLDFYGVLEPVPEFRSRFRKALAAQNPSVTFPTPEVKTKDSVPLNIVAHISYAGDTYFTDDSLIEDTIDRNRNIEGLQVMPATLPNGLRLEYMAHIAGQGDTQWLEAGEFLGTKGECKALEGIAMRLAGKLANDYEIYYQARLGLYEWTPIFKNGGYCGTRAESKPVSGMRIWLRPREQG